MSSRSLGCTRADELRAADIDFAELPRPACSSLSPHLSIDPPKMQGAARTLRLVGRPQATSLLARQIHAAQRRHASMSGGDYEHLLISKPKPGVGLSPWRRPPYSHA